MLKISCTGTPHTIGLQHGTAASVEIGRSLTFYSSLFLKTSKLDWSAVTQLALKYQPYLSEKWPQYVAEMQGVAEGAGVRYEDILALNVRTEIAFGAFSDGCTALSWKGQGGSVLGQNWDWNTEQLPNLICLKIEKEDGLAIQMITEAGIIGKIGLNSHGVGCTLNALKAKGVSFTRLPCHLALRTVMESSSRNEAISTLEASGVASACHILIADATGGTGLECTSEDVVRLEMEDGVVTHTNHMIVKHKESIVEVADWLPDTGFRLQRIRELLDEVKMEDVSVERVKALLRDEKIGDGASICRIGSGKEGSLATLFSIVMDLEKRTASVSMGRPVAPLEKLLLNF
ncbi:hypothetical protein VTL71DRAFT_2125 [Oculimacula yallundae]|uniref:Peptidase C45 hydrolase domain-containing protein n=1 Tax=Oculimacula yallundae TaxID=86028 RepID=A0ABR4C7Z5_9HELO